MNTPLRSQAQQRADAIAIFRAELARLEGEGVLRFQSNNRTALAWGGKVQ